MNKEWLSHEINNIVDYIGIDVLGFAEASVFSDKLWLRWCVCIRQGVGWRYMMNTHQSFIVLS
jgi:hypothetical protein